MSSRYIMQQQQQQQPQLNNSLSIRQEIQRFESVHPSIYAIYDLIEEIRDADLQDRVRDHVVCIEDSFVNSQEWTLSRSVPDIKLGILGSVNSGKSALVHRYLTGTYMQEESPEGGRFKKEVMIDGQSYLLLIRDEGGPPELQFTHWVDAVIFVFSLENEMSFHTVYNYYAKMAHYRNTAEIPLILVGTQDAISETNPRIIDDTRARKLAADLKRCSYYETCATYGLNVERVFQDACCKIVQSKMNNSLTPNNSRPSTPNHAISREYMRQSSAKSTGYDSHSSGSNSGSGTFHTPSNSSHNIQSQYVSRDYGTVRDDRKDKKHKDRRKDDSGDHYGYSVPPCNQQQQQLYQQQLQQQHHMGGDQRDQGVAPDDLQEADDAAAGSTFLNKVSRLRSSLVLDRQSDDSSCSGSKDLPTPSSTPTQSRKNRRRSNLFSQKKGDAAPPPSQSEEVRRSKNGEVGSGRAIPIKQGYLYKKSTKALNKEWKKKYVTLKDDGILTYHPNLHDYMDDVHGKEISLLRTTVKIPGMMKPRCATKGSMSTNGLLKSQLNDLSHKDDSVDPNMIISSGKNDTPNIKKRHKRAKSGALKNVDSNQQDDSDAFEFMIVSIDNKTWHFEGANHEEREEWVSAIEQQILCSLQANQSGKSKSRTMTLSDPSAVQTIRMVRGNGYCADCDAPNPDWASINLGALVCIECSGIHRNLGTHVSRVRSLDLDEWPPELVAVMTCIGNALANSVWENSIRRQKPSPTSQRELKETYIRAKYEHKEYLPPLPFPEKPIGQQLIDSIVRDDIRNVIILLAYAGPDDVNAPYSKQDARTALHIAAALGNFVYVQLLLWYNANVKVVDKDGRNALYYARTSKVPECVSLLQNNGCPENPTLPRRRSSQHQYQQGPVPVQPPVPPSGGNKKDSFESLPSSVI
ncbi:arf-GAP with GTPase, ANK repeat and PH domain-containing protein 1-like [Tubulanus polymorphus]|uniref:arf-GAP with GTPase, ANK repeat and PH domain-containing protein 1-like n=1 Tax=Tubulanus polymorphus TaxID=672921 RepID=UPI003DA41736